MVIVCDFPSRHMDDSQTDPFHFTRRIAYDEGLRLNGISIVGVIPVRRG
jgi:hypothetical protein